MLFFLSLECSIDAVAAACILDRYIEDRGVGAFAVSATTALSDFGEQLPIISLSQKRDNQRSHRTMHPSIKNQRGGDDDDHLGTTTTHIDDNEQAASTCSSEVTYDSLKVTKASQCMCPYFLLSYQAMQLVVSLRVLFSMRSAVVVMRTAILCSVYLSTVTLCS